MSENLVEKYATKTYIDKDYKDIVVNEKQFVNLLQENKKYKIVLDKIKEKTNKQLLSNTNLTKYTDEQCLKDILELLEEIE